MTVIRRLRSGEEPAFLELLDGWPFSDGRRGSEFFRKYVDDDHRFSAENVWVAEDAGRLVTCVQIFPRELRVGGEVVPAGGIGSVFTAKTHRRQGLAEQVLEACTLDMAQRGLSISLLSGTRARWYSSLGWRPWPSQSHRLRATESAPEGPEEFCRDDLEAVSALHTAYSGERSGCVERTKEDWETSLRVAGNPDESFTVARRQGRLVAYLRTARLGSGPLGSGQITEWGRDTDGAEELAQLIAYQASLQPESSINAPRLGDDTLEEALRACGIAIETADDPTEFKDDPQRPVWMLKPLGAGPWSVATHDDLLERLPLSDFRFWPSDRF